MIERPIERVLVVDDDRHVREILSQYLGDEGYRVICAPDGYAALNAVREYEPDIIVLDVRLPDKSGLDVLSSMRRIGSKAPVIMLTACAEEVDKIVGLELGADDYITKPFSSREVLARIRTVLRRTKGAEQPASTLRIGEMEIDREAREVRIAGESVPLTRTEFRIVELLARNPGRTFERSEILDSISAEGDVLERTLDKHIMNVRRKMQACGAGANAIVTVHGVGYKIPKPVSAPARAR